MRQKIEKVARSCVSLQPSSRKTSIREDKMLPLGEKEGYPPYSVKQKKRSKPAFENSGCSSACLLLCCLVSAIGRATFEDTFDNAQWRKVQLWQAPAQAPCGSHWQGLQRIHLRDAGPLRLLLRQGRERRNCSIAPALLGLLSTRVALLHKACPASAPDFGSPVLLCTNLSLHQAFFASAAWTWGMG